MGSGVGEAATEWGVLGPCTRRAIAHHLYLSLLIGRAILSSKDMVKMK